MKWKITLKYILTIILVVILVTVLNLIGLFMFVKGSQNPNYEQSEEVFTRNFKNCINYDGESIYINQEGKKELNKKNNWIQILDENGQEVYNYKKPNIIKDKHTPMELINGYKYAGGLNKKSVDTILVGDKIINKKQYTYIIGFPMRGIDKLIFIYNSKSMLDTFSKIMINTLIIDILIALIFGYIFSKRLISPMKTIISGVENLEEKKYDIYYKEKGLYADVYRKLNNLADTLKINEIERKKTDDMRQEWIANISHDIKTPLSSIKGYAELLSDEYDFSREEIQEYGNIINNKSEYIKELVDDLNLTMKLKNNKSVLNKKEANIVSVVRDAVIDILNDPNYRDIDLEFISDKEIIKKDIDIILIRRVISNLLYNSIVHNNKDISIVVKIYEKDKTHIIIQDSGKGIREEDLKYIFERYYRGTNTGEAHKGSGLGMAIAKEIIIAHNGEINIKSKLDEGTAIEIKL